MADIEPPLIREPAFFPFPNYEVSHLSNGIPLHVIPFNSIDFTNVVVSVGAGTQRQHKLLQASLTGRMLREGCSGFTSEQLAEELDFYGTVYKSTVSTLRSEVLFSSVSRHLPKMMPLLQKFVFSPTFQERDFAMANNISKQNLVHSLQEVGFLANRQLKAMLFGEDHVYARTASPDDFDKISVDDLKQFHSEFYLPNNIEIFASGRFSNEQFSILNDVFGSMPVPKIAFKPDVEPAANTCSDVRRLKEKDGVQSAVYMGYVTIAQQHPDYLKLKLLVAVLGGYFGSRLMSNIREDKGYTYGIYAQLIAYTHMSTLVISSQTAVEHTNDLINEVYKEVERLINEPIPEEELVMVKRYYKGLYLQQVSKGLDLLPDYRVKVLNGIDTQSYYKEWWNVLCTATPSDLQAIARKYLNPDWFRVSIAGKC